MRRTDLIDGIEEVRTALEASDLAPRLTTLFMQEERASEDAFQEQLLDALKSYAVATDSFSPAAQQIARALKLHVLAESATWIRLLAATDRRLIRLLHERILVATKHLPGLTALLAPAPLPSDGAFPADDGHRLTLLVAAEEERPVPPRRLAIVMESLQKLYEITGHLYGDAPGPLQITGCDTGSDLTFDFAGDEELIGKIKTLFTEVGDRLVFFRSLDVAERIEQATARLSMLDEIAAQRERDRLSPEQAELLRRRLRDHVAALLQASAFIPEMEAHTRFDPRELIGPAPRLLTDAAAANAPGDKPWRITSALPASDEQPAAAPPPAMAEENTEPAATGGRVAYLLDEIKSPTSARAGD